MRLLRYLFRTSPYIAVLAIVTAFVSGLSNASLITLIHKALNRESLVDQSGWIFIGFVLFALITSVISQIILSYLYRKAIFDWRIHLSREILKAPLRDLEEIGDADLLTVLVKDISAIGSSFLPLLPLCTNIVIVCVCFAYLCWLSWQLFLGIAFCLLIGATSYRFVLLKGRAILKLAREESQQLVKQFQLLTGGLKELKLHSHRRQAFLDQKLKPTAALIHQYFFFWSVMHALTQTWAKFLLFFVMGLILFAFPQHLSVNKEILTGYVLTLLYIRAMLFSIMGAMPALTNANVAFEKIESLGFKLIPEVSDQTASLEPIHTWKALELVNVSHTYYREREDSNFTLGPINFKFFPGELVFLVGGNGSGKTTLAKLITGLYVPEIGNIYLDGEVVHTGNREWYRQLFSVVFADFQLFENLLGLDNPHLDARAQEYLYKLQLNHKVKIQDGNLSTTALSRGQQQRLTLLTAYLEDRPFYIFDEWASNQDPMFTNIFYTQFLPELKAQGKTVLVITHDDKYFHLCDRIIQLDGMVQQGQEAMAIASESGIYLQ